MKFCVAVPSEASSMVVREMPADNSCLFHSILRAYRDGPVDTVPALRALVAETILLQPDTYSAAILGRPADEYCQWIQSEYSWGGGIELSILSQLIDIEICCVNYLDGSVQRFNEGRTRRIILIYSGFHYDIIALSPSEAPFEQANASEEFDVTVFDATDDVLLKHATDFGKILKAEPELRFPKSSPSTIIETGSSNQECEDGGQEEGRSWADDVADVQRIEDEEEEELLTQCTACDTVFVTERMAIEHRKVTGHTKFRDVT